MPKIFLTILNRNDIMYADVVTDKGLLAVRTSVGVCDPDVKETRIFFGKNAAQLIIRR